MLGQLNQGVPDKVEEVSERLRRWGLGASVGFAKADAGRQSSNRQQETRSLAELHFAMFEEVAQATGFLHDISNVAKNSLKWENGAVQKFAPEGSIIRIEAPSTIIDGHYFSEVVGHLIDSGQLGDSQSNAKAVHAVMKAMYPKGVVIRIMPCGIRKPNHGFVGTLLDSSEYIGPERSALHGRYGNEARDWITVGIVSRIGARVDPNKNFVPDGLRGAQGGAFERDKLDSLVQNFSSLMEAHGGNESPAYPGMAIVPLAVYRPIVSFAPVGMKYGDFSA
ncbi:hypothetical protein [Actinoplanes sp. TFC3]|uniref:DUF6414 family protein n=1 Tax=Actinoplanes sp. TFC3 TaxID=1710355 RepID=UPI00129034EB|nr:hypothetical protein [Actinoplanes sp. TFC3]